MSELSNSWYRVGRKPLFNSGFEDDEFSNYGRDGFREVLDSFIGQDVRLYPKAMAFEPRIVRAIIQNSTADAINTSVSRQILCEIGELHCGQYVVDQQENCWLVSGMPDHNGIYEKAVLWKCRYSIRMRSKISGGIVEYPVYVIDSTQYGTGESVKPNITIGSAQYLVYLPYNKETISIDNGFRFIMDKNRVDPTVYEVTKADPISFAVGGEREEDGLIQLSCKETQLNLAVDNPEEMVADFYPSNGLDPDVSEQHDLKLDVGLDDDEIAIGETRTIPILNGDKTDPVVTLTPAGTAELFSCDGESVVIEAVRERRNIGMQITVTIEQSGKTASAVLRIVGW